MKINNENKKLYKHIVNGIHVPCSEDKDLTKYGYCPEEYKKFKEESLKFLVGFSLLYCCLYCIRLNLSAAMPLMMKQEGWKTGELGIISGVFFWSYGIGQLFNGRLAEVFGVNRFVIGAVLLSAAANIFFSFQSSIIVMAVAWGFNGYFQSMSWGPGMAALAKWWPGNKRGFATGFANAFSGFGQAACILGVAFAFSAAPKMGWRAAFIIPTIFPLGMLIIYKIFTKSKPSDVGLQEYKEEDQMKAEMEAQMKDVLVKKGPLYPYIYLLSNWRFTVWLAISFFTGLSIYGFVTWVPLYFIKVFKVNIQEGLLGSLALPIGMGLGTLVVPWLTDRFCSKNRLPAVIVSGIIAAVSVYLFYLSQPGVLAECLLFIAGFFLYALNGLVCTFATDIGGRVLSGTASGFLNWSSYMGAATQAVYFGFALNKGGWGSLYFAITAALLILVLLAIVATAGDRKGRKRVFNS